MVPDGQSGLRPAAAAAPRRALPALLAVTLLVLLPGNDVIPLIDRDEPRFAQAAREMIEADDWVIPYFNGGYRFDKPPLIYWMMRGSYAVFGINEWSARFPSVLTTLLLVWLVYGMGRRWFTESVGFASAFGLATSMQILIHGRSAVADMPMILFVTLSQYALFEMLRDTGTAADGEREKRRNFFSDRRSRRLFLLLYGSIGAGFLAKGPVAFAVPALMLLAYRFVFLRRRLPRRHRKNRDAAQSAETVRRVPRG